MGGATAPLPPPGYATDLHNDSSILIYCKWRLLVLKADLRSIRFSSAFVRFCKFCLLHEKVYVLYCLHFYKPLSALARLAHTGQKFFEKKFVKGL